ncbi:MAG TPA: carbon-nitrogen hydrolase family protein [Phycisphaerae bacterium]|nr:carbon-nitrogen hydrolase family protein [Phycisphaerae bacterium]
MGWWKRECDWMTVIVMVLGFGLVTHGTETQPANDDQKGEPSRSHRVGVSCICHPAGRSIAEMDKLIDAAALDQPDLILLTEGCMQNSAPSASRAEKDARSEPLPESGPITQFLARKARQHRAYIMGSYWRKGPKGQGRYNSAVLVDRQGKLVGWYDKVFPTIGEMEEGVLPGREAVVFDTDFGRIGALICFDLNFPELLAEYKQRGAKLLCFLSAFRGGRLIPAAAMRNQCFIASAVPGENGVIVDPLGRSLAESSQYGRIIFARINLDSQIVHIDYNADRVQRMKEKYGPTVTVDTASPEAVFFLSSLHPEKSIQDMIREFEVETLDVYLDRAREVRQKHLGATASNPAE